MLKVTEAVPIQWAILFCVKVLKYDYYNPSKWRVSHYIPDLYFAGSEMALECEEVRHSSQDIQLLTHSCTHCGYGA